MKTLKLTEEQCELLLEVLASAEIEANFASKKKHVLFLPDLFKTLSDHQKDLASLKEAVKMVLE